MAGVNHHKELERALLSFRRGNAWPDGWRHSRNLGRLRLQRYRLAIVAADDIQMLIPGHGGEPDGDGSIQIAIHLE